MEIVKLGFVHGEYIGLAEERPRVFDAREIWRVTFSKRAAADVDEDLVAKPGLNFRDQSCSPAEGIRHRERQQRSPRRVTVDSQFEAIEKFAKHPSGVD